MYPAPPLELDVPTQNERDWVSDASLINLPIGKLVEGRGVGSRRSFRNGDGFDFSGVRPFRDGDEVRRVDWSATARTGELHVRSTQAESGMRTLLALDMNPNMLFGTAGWKADSALEIVMLLGHSAARRGDQIAVTSAKGTSQPASGSRAHLLLASSFTSIEITPTTILVDLLIANTHPSVPTGLVIVVTEIFSDLFTTNAEVLQMLSLRHDLIVVILHDPSEIMLPLSNATYLFSAPGSNKSVSVDLSNRSLLDSYADSINNLREATRSLVTDSGGFIIEISTADNVTESIINACELLSIPNRRHL